MQEKIVQNCAKRFVVIGGFDKYSVGFGRVAKSIPIEIAPSSLVPVQKWIIEKHGFFNLFFFVKLLNAEFLVNYTGTRTILRN